MIIRWIKIKNSKILVINISSQFATLIFGKIFGAIAGIALIRYLGAEKQGIYSYILSVIYIFGFFADFGINKFLTREVRISGEKARELLGNGIIVQLIQVLLAILLVNLYAYLFQLNQGLRYELLIASIALNLGYASHPFIATLNSFEKMYFTGLSNAVTSIVNAILIFTAIYLKLPILGIFVMLGISNIVNIMLSFFLCSRFAVKPLFNISREKIKYVVMGCMPFVAIGLFSSFYTKINVLILYKMTSAIEVGYFTGATKIIEILTALLAMISLPLYPRLSYILNKDSGSEATRVMNLGIKYLMGLVAPFALMVTMFNYDYTVLLLGDAFLNSRLVLAIIIWSIFIMSVFSIATHAVNAARLSGYIVVIYAVAGITNVILNIIFIPKYSYVATSVILLITNMLIAVAVLIVVNTKIGKLFIFVNLFKLILSLIPSFILWYFAYGKLSFIVLSLAGIALFGISVIVTRYIDNSDLKKLKGIFSKSQD